MDMYGNIYVFLYKNRTAGLLGNVGGSPFQAPGRAGPWVEGVGLEVRLPR